LKITRSSRFKKDYKSAKKQKKNLKILIDTIQKLVNQESIPPSFRDHKLTGRLRDYRELHLQPDWLLIYRIDKDNNELLLVRLGSHSELYK
jgi:mRNA interferase YafQ